MNAKTFLATTGEGVRGLNSFRMENGTYVSSDGRLNFVELGMFARFTRKMQAGSKYVSWLKIHELASGIQSTDA